MKPAAALILASLLLAPLPAFAGAGAEQAPGQTAAGTQGIQTDLGWVMGAVGDGVAAFKGIPYAAPPIGDNRWRAPQPAKAWDMDANVGAKFGHDCAQAIFPPDMAPLETTPSEDCLYLNIWKPAQASSAKLPVVVWIHGGGFVNGGSSPGVYSGASFARDGVVFVSFNYRLGRFGFFAHPALADQGYGGNFGFLDQIAALKWVRANIAAFGGDPMHVTVVGESAGGMSVHMLLQSPLARGLFTQAIIESGGGRAGTLPMPTIAGAARAGQAFAPGLTAADLRALPEARVTGGLNMANMDETVYSGPMVDGRTIFGSPLEAAAAGMDAPVPVLIGANSADGFPFMPDKAKIFAAFGAREAAARALYDPTGQSDGLTIATATSADRMMIEPARAVARALGAHQPVWLYRFAYGSGPYAAKIGGAPHASEIPYAFDTLAARKGQSVTASDAQVAELTHRIWVTFAKTGLPDSAANWPTVTARDTTVQRIDASGASHIEDPLSARLNFTEEHASAK